MTLLLNAAHLQQLTEGSGLPESIIQERGYQSLPQPEDLIDRGFSKAQARTAPALGIPLWDVHGQRRGWQIRPDAPRQMRDGKVFKYELPKGERLILDVHPSVQPLIGDPTVPLWITEGVKKGDALASQGACTIALQGVWGFKGSNAHGGKVILPDWEYVALNSRVVHVVYDSDLSTNRSVDTALKALWTFLRSRQALPDRVHWPQDTWTHKVGVDDYFVQGHTLDDLLTLIPPARPLPTTPPGRNGTTPSPGGSGGHTHYNQHIRDCFTVDDTGLWYQEPPDADGDQPPRLRVCDRLDIVAATCDVENNNHGHLLTFRDRHGHVQQWAMPLELLEEHREYRKVLRRLGLIMNGSRDGQHALQLYLDNCHAEARARCVDRVGWHGRAYVLPDGPIGDTAGEMLVLQTLDKKSEGYRQAGTLEGWQREIAARCVGNSRLTLAVSTGFAAPLLALLGEESGGLHLRGASSEGKTTAVLVAATVWGEPGRMERWRATANAIEGVCLAHNDNLLCLDELKELDPREAGITAYMIANGAGKRRGQPHGGTLPRLTWRLLFLSTGEMTLEQHMAEAGHRIRAGQEVRMVDLPADAGAGHGLFEHLHGVPSAQKFADALREAVTRNYGHAGRRFVEVVAADRDGCTGEVRALLNGFVAEHVPPGASGQVLRVARRFALIGAAGELATAHQITGWAEGEAIQAAARCLQVWLEARGSTGDADETRALAQVRHFFEAYGRSRFEPWTIGEGKTCQRCKGTGKVHYDYLQGLCFTCQGAGVITPDHPAMRLIQQRAGWSKATDDGRTEFYVLREVFKQDIAKGYDLAWLCRLLVAQNFLVPDGNGKHTRKERLPGKGLDRVYKITAELLGEADPQPV